MMFKKIFALAFFEFACWNLFAAGNVEIKQGSGGGTLTIQQGTGAAGGAGSGDITDVNAGFGIIVTNPTGPAPTVAVDPNITISSATYIVVRSNTEAAIQAAINLLDVATSSGGIVHIPAGTYPISTGITLTGLRNVVVEGEGRTNTILVPAAGVNTFTVGGTTNTNAEVFIQNLRILGSATDNGDAFDSGIGITFTNHSRGVISAVRMVGGTEGALIQVTNATGTVRNSSMCIIKDSEFITAEGPGIHFRNNLNTDTNFNNAHMVYGNRIANNGKGVWLENQGTGSCGQHEFTNNTFGSNSGSEPLIVLAKSNTNIFSVAALDGVIGSNMVIIDTDSVRNVMIFGNVDGLVTSTGTGNIIIENDNFLTQVTMDHLFTASEGAIMNNGGGANDFRVAGVSDSNVIFTKGSSNRVGISTNVPEAKLHVVGGDVLLENTMAFAIKDNTGTARNVLDYTSGNNVRLRNLADSGFTQIANVNASGSVRINTGTNSDEAIRVTAAGLTGFNTTSPDSEVHIIPNATNQQGLIIQSTPSQSANLFEVKDATGTINLYIDKDGILNGVGYGLTSVILLRDSLQSGASFYVDKGTVNTLFTSNRASVFNEGGGANDTRVEGASDQNLLFVKGSGDRVGISTNSPDAKLHVVNGDILLENTFALKSRDTTGSIGDIVTYTSGNNLQLKNSATTGNIQLTNASTGGFIQLNTKSLERVNVSSGGLVGIGLMEQNAMVHILPNLSTVRGMIIQSTTSQSANPMEIRNATGTIMFFVGSNGVTNLSLGAKISTFNVTGLSPGVMYIIAGSSNVETAASGVINTSTNPVDWTLLKNVPAAFADGTDDGAGGGGASTRPSSFTYVFNAEQAGLGKYGLTAPAISNSTAEAMGSLLFDETSTMTVVYSTVLQPYYGGQLAVDFIYTSSATSGTVNFGAYVQCDSPTTAALDTASFGTINSTSTTTNSTTGMQTKATIALTNGDSCAAGNTVILKVERSAGLLDTMVGFAKLRKIVFYEQ
jgi:hypothetical protein